MPTTTSGPSPPPPRPHARGSGRCREGATALPRPQSGAVHGLSPGPGRGRLAGGQRRAGSLGVWRPEPGGSIRLRHDLRPAAPLSPEPDAAVGHGRRAEAGGHRRRGGLSEDAEEPAARREEPGAQSGHPAEAGRLRRQPRPHEQSGGGPRRGCRRRLGDEGVGGQGLRRLPRGRAGGGDEGRGDPLSPVRGPVSARDGDRGLPRRARSRDHGDGAARRERGQSRPDRARQDGLERHAGGARPRRAGDMPPPSSAASARSTGASASATTRAPTATRRRAARAPTSSSAGGSSPMSSWGSRGTSRPGARARPTCGTCASACSGA